MFVLLLVRRVCAAAMQLEERNRSKKAEQEEVERKAARFKARIAAKSASSRLIASTAPGLSGSLDSDLPREKTPEEQMADKLLARQQQYLSRLAERRQKEKENEEAAAEASKQQLVKVRLQRSFKG